MDRFFHDKTNGLDYELIGDYYLPCLKAPESPKVGRFGMMYHDYLRSHKRVTYSGLMLSGKLKAHVEDIDRQAEELFSQLEALNPEARYNIWNALEADNKLVEY